MPRFRVAQDIFLNSTMHGNTGTGNKVAMSETTAQLPALI